MPKIFISYGRDASHGQNLATEAQQQLQSAGFEVFRDVIGLKPGDVWYSKLEFELESSDLVVLVISEKIRKSEWVHNEISMAKEIGLPIIPVIAEHIRMPLWLRHLQALDFSNGADWLALSNIIAESVNVTCKASVNLSGYTDNDLYNKAVEVVTESQKASISFLRHRLNIEYEKASSLMGLLEKSAIVSGACKGGTRIVLVSSDVLYSDAVNIVAESQRASVSYLQRRLKIGYSRASLLLEHMTKVGVVSEVQDNGLREVIYFDDELFDSAVDIVVESRRASISYIQRRLKIGYNKAASVIERMEKVGVVSEVQQNGTRLVLQFDVGLYNSAVDAVIESQIASAVYLEEFLQIEGYLAELILDKMETDGVVSKIGYKGEREILVSSPES